jgi:hypothetical protein
MQQSNATAFSEVLGLDRSLVDTVRLIPGSFARAPSQLPWPFPLQDFV